MDTEVQGRELSGGPADRDDPIAYVEASTTIPRPIIGEH